MGVRLSVQTPFGILGTGWPFARISIGQNGVEFISILPLRSEWFSPIDEIISVKADGHSAIFARADGGMACFRFFSWKHDAIVAALIECGLNVEHAEAIT
jgi:hypothetical protein